MINLWGYVAVAGLIVLAPGLDTMVVVKNALRGGLGQAVRTAAGVCTGLIVWAVVCALGLAAVLAASGAVFTGIKITGAAYLVFIGARTVIASRRAATAPMDQPIRGTWWQGAITNLGNPKVGVFYTSFLPQFIPEHDNNAVAVFLVLAAVHITFGFVCLLGYAFLAVRLGDIFQRRRWRQALETVMGIALCGLGVGLIATAAGGMWPHANTSVWRWA